ncbi:MAG TPA: zinc ribbon domain-containing protein [Candidatus Polarisedimenticolaceae bacterium]|nr:zinc ribbon domain-containing protein [Candidatus Polarisedimenticolaceae bacterium]
MPIYEFYCAGCHRIFNFLSRTGDTSRRPDCPRCGRPRLERRPSRFAISKGRPAAGAEGEGDDAQLDAALESLAGEAERLDESDPRQVAGLMRRLHERTGMPLGTGMEEAIRRMEAGEDPDAVEDRLGELLDAEEPEASGGRVLGALRRRLRPPAVDTQLYEL